MQRGVLNGRAAGENLELGRVLEMLFDRALIGGADNGRFIFFREFWGQLDIQQHLAHQARPGVSFQALQNAHAIGGQAALLAEAQNINAGTGADRGQKSRKGRRGGAITVRRRLVGGDSIRSKISIDL